MILLPWDGTFINRIDELGLDQFYAYVKGCAAGDVNNDGWTDLFISNMDGENALLLNNSPSAEKGGLISLKNVTNIAGVQEPLVSFSAWMFDFNNDGLEDIFAGSYGVVEGKPAAYLAALNYLGQKTEGAPCLYINNGNGAFSEIGKSNGFDEALFTMGANYGDIDNDGWIDIYLGTGSPMFTSIVPNKMYRNNKGKSLQDVTTAGDFGHVQKGHGIGFGDFDNDGDQDIFSVIGGALEGDIFANAFFLNPIGNQKNWITIKLEGTTSNRSAIGARVKIVTVNAKGQERAIFNTVSTGSSFGGNSLQLEIGLDDAQAIKTLEMTWPNLNRTKQIFNGIGINKFIKIKEGRDEIEYLNLNPRTFIFTQ